MNNRLVTAIVSLSLVLPASCGRQQDVAPTRQEDIVAAVPFLEIVSRQEFKFGPETTATIWNIRGQKLKELTARLLVCTDGQCHKNNEIICRWREMSKAVSAQLVYLVHDGQPFGVKGKRLPSLSLSFRAGGPDTRIESNSMTIVRSDLGQKMSSARDAQASVSERQLVFTEIAAPLNQGKASNWSLSSDGSEEGLAESSKNGGVAIGVIVEWKKDKTETGPQP
jgi:hypothetical protein